MKSTTTERPKRHVALAVYDKLRENHAQGLHTDHREYCPDCRFERGVGEERR